jgi:hypothetical protein
MDGLRQRIIADFERSAGRHDDPEICGGPPGDPGLLGLDAICWAINADLAAVSQGGLRAIVLEILHPSVVAGVQDLSNYRRDPIARARARPRRLIEPALQADARRLRWAFGTPRFVTMARARAAGVATRASAAGFL